MVVSFKGLGRKVEMRLYYYLRFVVKTITFLFWVSLYMTVMKMTIFKSTEKTPDPAKDWMVTDNYTKWLLQGPVLGDEPEDEVNILQEADNEIEPEILKRVDRLHQVCNSEGLTSQPINSKEFFVDHAHNLVWCNIFKAASSSWMYKFNILGGYKRDYLARSRHTPFMLARKKFPRPSEEELIDVTTNPNVISLLIVREPFVRLLSAYRDKLESITRPYYRKLAKSIVADHRKEAELKFGPIKSHGPTFFEFVKYLIKKHKAKDMMFDEHWAPYYQFCSPCAINFNVIAKVETLARDSAYVIQHLKLTKILGTRVKSRRTRLRTVMNKSRDGKNTTALVRQYYRQLDEQMLKDLLDIYGIDFKLFGYDPTIYMSYARNTTK